ncbi:hypothetical protein [Croceibacterium ferulae]|nr:hypothetical protein [Croceibacterium ferulae]
MDYTPGDVRNTAPADFTVQSTLPNVQTTRARGLAIDRWLNDAAP